jgi:outer membrane protein assembly factor BamE (lipoprotein component of BamABCDE complex)
MAPVSARTRENVLSRKVSLSKAAAVFLALLLSACVTIGRDFSASKVYDIQIGKTTQTEIKTMFGSPWRVGIDDGRPTWTYANYHYNAFGEAKTKDLVVRFDANYVVKSYTFNTSDPADIRKR